MDRPNLIEPGVKYWLGYSLKECNQLRKTRTSLLFNIVILILFILVVGGYLTYKYKGKLTHAELVVKHRREKEYIMSKLQQISFVKNKFNDNLITDIPAWSTPNHGRENY